MPKYELVIIYDPLLAEPEVTAQLDRIKEAITRRSGEIVNVDLWGKKRLAYQINKKSEGIYVVITFQMNCDGPAMAEIERALRLNEQVMRSMFTRIPKPKIPKKVKPRKVRPAGQEGGYQQQGGYQQGGYQQGGYQGGYQGGQRHYEPRSAGPAGAAQHTPLAAQPQAEPPAQPSEE